MSIYLIDPDAVLDYAFDWTRWLADSEAIDSHTIIASSGITVDSSAESNGVVTIWVSAAEVGAVRSATCRVVTDQGRTDDRTIRFSVNDR